MQLEMKKSPFLSQMARERRLIRLCILLICGVGLIGLILYYVTVGAFIQYVHPLLRNETEFYLSVETGSLQLPIAKELLASLLGEDSVQELEEMQTVFSHTSFEGYGILQEAGERYWFVKNPQEDIVVPESLMLTDKTINHQRYLIFGSKPWEQDQAAFSLRDFKKQLNYVNKQGKSISLLLFSRMNGAALYGVAYRENGGLRMEMGKSTKEFFQVLEQREQRAGVFSLFSETTPVIFPLARETAAPQLAFEDALWPGEWTLLEGTPDNVLRNPYDAESQWFWSGQDEDRLREAILSDLAFLYPASEPHELPDGSIVFEVRRSSPETFEQSGPAGEQLPITFPGGQVFVSEGKVSRGSEDPGKRINTCVLPLASSYGYLRSDALWTDWQFSFRDGHFIACL